MKIKFDRPTLLDAVGVAMYGVSVKSTIASAEGILISCEEGKVILTSYDLEKGMRISIDAQIEEPGACIINAQSLYSIIKLMPAGIIEMETDSMLRAKISSGSSEFE